jgi:RNA polymerase sigma-70 factor (sigma-E family)
VPSSVPLGCVQPLATPLELAPPPPDGDVVVPPEVVVADVVAAEVEVADVVDAAVDDAAVDAADELDADVDAGGDAADDDFLELPPQPAISTTITNTGTSAPSARISRGQPTTPMRSPPQAISLSRCGNLALRQCVPTIHSVPSRGEEFRRPNLSPSPRVWKDVPPRRAPSGRSPTERNRHELNGQPQRQMKLAGRKRSSFEAFAEAHGTGLIRLGLMVSGDRGRAEDAAQEALVRVYQRWSRLDDPLAYARRIVVNATRDDWRRAERATRAHDDAGRLGRPHEAADVEASFLQRDALLGALAALPHRQRAVIVLRYLSELSEAETAAVLEISVGTVKRQAFDALARLRQILGAELITTTHERETCA